MHLGSKNHQIWGEHVSQYSLCITGALGVANMKEKKNNNSITPTKKRSFSAQTILGSPDGYDKNLCIN